MANEVSSTRLYLGNIPRGAQKSDIEAHFATHEAGKITEVKLMNGFGFIEYDDARDAADVVPAFHGSTFMGERLTVQFARGTRPREAFAHAERTAPRPRRTQYRMQISGLPTETSWQDLKDFARQSKSEVVYSETGRDRDGRGFVEFETAADLKSAVEKLDQGEFKGNRVTTQAEVPRSDRPRSRSPRGRYDDPYDRRGPPRGGYSPRRDGGYRERSPPRRDYYEDRGRYGRSPPRARGPPIDDYPPPGRRPYDDRRDYLPPDPYAPPRGYDRGPPRDYAREAPYPPRDYPRERDRY